MIPQTANGVAASKPNDKIPETFLINSETGISADFVLQFQVPDRDKDADGSAQKHCATLLQTLRNRRFAYQLDFSGQKGDRDLLIFVRCSDKVFLREVRAAKLQDWLLGIGGVELKTDIDIVSKISINDRLRIVYDLLTRPEAENRGMALLDQSRPWASFLSGIYGIHDTEYNKKWVAQWSSKWQLSTNDFTEVRGRFGESIALYFAFVQFYFNWLTIPTVLGILVYFFDSEYSIFYGLAVNIWALLFTEIWARKEANLSALWGVRRCSKREKERPDFVAERIAADPITGQPTKYFPPHKRLLRQLFVLPLVALMVALLLTVIAFIFILEVIMTEYYDGPYKQIIEFAPTIVYVLLVPFLTSQFMAMSRKLTNFENNRTESEYSNSLVKKFFAFNFLINFSTPLFGGLFYTRYMYLLDPIFKQYLGASDLQIQTDRFQSTVICFVLTGQIQNLFEETLLPYVLRIFSSLVKHRSFNPPAIVEQKSKESSARSLIKKVREELTRDAYSVDDDYNEMVMQFGYVTLFGTVWPLTSLCALINNWVESRSDAVKICINMKRPVSQIREESIGTWLGVLRVLCWLSCIMNAVWILMYRYAEMDGSNSFFSGFDPSVAILIIIAAEHLYLVGRYVLGSFLDAIPTDADIKEEHEQWELRQKYLRSLDDDDDSQKTIAPSVESSIQSLAQSADSLEEFLDELRSVVKTE